VCGPRSGGEATPAMLCGLCWRVAEIEVARARLLGSGIDVSEVRIGRKPGTRVMSVRSGTCGIHTLFLERTAQAAGLGQSV